MSGAALCSSLAPLLPPPLCSLAEAQAYCRLHGARLMSEAEWELAAASEAAASGAVQQLEAGGWEWTASAFGPLPGGLACEPAGKRTPPLAAAAPACRKQALGVP